VVSLFQEYGSHEQFGDEFKSFLDQLVEEFGPIPQDSDKETGKEDKENGKDKEKDGQNNKDGENRTVRKRKNAQNGNDATKKLKVDTNKIKTIESVGAGGALLETPLINAKIEGVQLHLKPQNRPYLFNTGNQEASLKAGLILCGYGKGKWRLADAQSQEANPGTEVLFNLTGPDDFVAGMFGIHHVWFGVVDFNPQQMYKKNILLSIYGTLLFDLGLQTSTPSKYSIVDIWDPIIRFGVVDCNPQQKYGKNILLSIYRTLLFGLGL
jgi:hypothetical protein